jgi:hypothetical protein
MICCTDAHTPSHQHHQIIILPSWVFSGVIQCISELQLIDGFIQVLRFRTPRKLTASLNQHLLKATYFPCFFHLVSIA